MCDTFIALPHVTQNHHLIPSKNSDREPDEPQALLHVSRKVHAESNLQCTFIQIPQIRETYECILSKPFQMWGAEMGVNEFGLAIGNEAVFTKVKFQKKNQGLTGMDLLRLALERCKNSFEAIECITSLLELYGQDACGGYRNKNFYYHNSFLIADPKEAWVLETAGREWAIEKVKDIRSISNGLTISNADRISDTAKSNAASKGWWKVDDHFNFAKAYSDWLYTTVGRASRRQACTTELSMAKRNHLNVSDCMRILQTHNHEDDFFTPRKANTGSICMHATGMLNPSSTTGSMVAEIRSENAPHTVWLTGTSTPCLSVYLPFFMGTSTLEGFLQPGAVHDHSLWWRAEQLHRWICKDYRKRKALINDERLQLQETFVTKEKVMMLERPSRKELEKFSNDCLQEFNDALACWSTLMPA